MIDLLLSNPNIDVNDKYINKIFDEKQYIETTPLFEAVKNKNIKIVNRLLSHLNIDVNFINKISN